MRIGGLASGMDTDQIIKDMMKAHRIPLDKMTQKKQYTQWILDDYRSTNRDMKKLSDKLLDTAILQRNYMHKKVSVSDENAVSIRAVGASNDFSGTIEVHHLAKQAALQGGVIDGKPSDADFSKMKVKDLASGISYDEEGNATLDITVGTGEVKKVTFNEEMTLDTVLKKINSDTGVNAFYDSFSGQIAMTAKNSGEAYIQVSGELAKALKIESTLGTDGSPQSEVGAKSSAGQNAQFTFNGLKTERESNTFQINGFEVNLKQTTPEGSQVTFSSTTDTDKVVDTVVQFVNDYNELIEKLNDKIREKNYRNFQPLSDEEKKEMTDKEIELWEEKAKSGTMRNDPAISSMLSSLRTIMTKSIDTTDKDGNPMTISLADIGIKPSTSYSDNGKLVIDETKLREKIAENPNAIYDLIGRSDDTVREKGGTNNGIAQEYRKVLQDTQKIITEKAGSSGAVNDTFALGREMKNMDKQIERFQAKLTMMEDRYYRQFAAMERAIQRANAQSAQLMNSFGGGM